MLHHLDAWTDVVHVTERTLIRHDVASRRVLLLSESGKYKSVHLRKLAKSVADDLPNLFEWKLVSHGCGQTVRRHELPSLADTVAPMIVPNSSLTISAAATREAAGRNATTALATTADDRRAMYVLSMLSEASQEQRLERIPFHFP